MNILNEGTIDLRAGRCIDDLLEDLAPHVLCKRFHQCQSSDLATRWQKQVRSFLRSQEHTTAPRTLAQPFRAVDREQRQEYLDERCTVLYLSLCDTLEELRQLQASYPARNLDTRVQLFSGTVRTNGIIHPNSSGSRSRSAGRAQLSHMARQEATNASRSQSPERQGSSTILSNGVSYDVQENESLSRAPVLPRGISFTDHTASITSSRRRPVEGECGICLCSLNNVDDDEESDSEDEGEDGYDYAPEGEEQNVNGDEVSLVWCKATCGVNFHEECLHQWLETSPNSTCPTCRSPWRY